MFASLFRWRAAAALISLLTLIPLAVIAQGALQPDVDVWRHLAEHALPELWRNTAILLLGVGGGVLLLGVPLAWLTAVHDFPGRRLFAWALMLPLAMPAYVMAFAQLGLFEFTGPLQTALREAFGDSSWVPDIRSAAGVVTVLSLAFYPYVYLLARDAFSSMGRRALEVGQSLGLSPLAGFFRVALPMARPWIIAGLSLALMETLADFGAVAIFNYDAFTSAIYKAWFSLFSLPAAKQLASLLVLLVLALLWLEQRARGARGYGEAGRAAPLPRVKLSGAGAWLACAFCALVLSLAFILPFGLVLVWAAEQAASDLADLLEPLRSSLLLAALAAALVPSLAMALAFAGRRDPGSRLWTRLATLGYAVPGTVLAVGVFVPVAALDNWLLAHAAGWLPAGATAVFKGSLLVMLLAYCSRFLAVGHSAVDAAMQRIGRSQEEAAQSLGVSGWRLAWRLHLPLLRGGMATAMLMVFIDVMKEMPITLMTRPFGWDTLAVRIFNLTTEGEWQRAALPSAAIVLAGLLPVLLLSRRKTGA
ncbi:iron ABC transporter permease [Chromobacterium sp. IIBBL 290-4]|uniref:ABC transporter permease n=1 Tax=Chromobacterium sp. IIBBL 290-4 TaxID=2953890 RepID=UPI0020B854B2|nr:iron ABC transporter permease [Chromobacterium sp. IIBBL 290-4]UTH74173.1 iron ABC transporter permease [Chromobacterium sp. IIBBL 290-4]